MVISFNILSDNSEYVTFLALIIEVSNLSILRKNISQSHLINYLRQCLQNNLTFILKIFQ